uniref:NADH-ubiquinone oxidoreductase chain 3 n=1 Tax=Echiniscus testudo TaxID=399800 RepID=A0A348BR58_ECHTS|nr:NADH dehydrogenase subunit 3 [Echiniscus testudo]
MFLLISFFFIIIFLLMILFLSYFTSLNFENKTFFECGFDSVQSYRSLFSLRFFSISIVFLIFDMEMMFILPLILFYNFFKFFLFYIYIMLILGLYLEWNQGGLQWK